jgi:hypothetical protein
MGYSAYSTSHTSFRAFLTYGASFWLTYSRRPPWWRFWARAAAVVAGVAMSEGGRGGRVGRWVQRCDISISDRREGAASNKRAFI